MAAPSPQAGHAAAGILVPDWPLPPGVQAAVTTRELAGVSTSPFEAGNLGSRCGDAPQAVAANRALLRQQLALPGEPDWLRQVHGTAVHVSRAPGDPARSHQDDPVADAVYADRPGLVCAVQTADCLPLLICSDDGSEIAAVHAGWRGLAGGVIEAALAAFRAPSAQLRVWLGPAIAAASYEVGDDVRDAFLVQAAGAAAAFTATRPGHWLCDLYLLARQRLAAAGVQQVHGGGLDTYSDARFYSHRRGHPTGRFASLIWIAPQTEQAPLAVKEKPMQSASAATATAPRSPSPLLFPRLLGAAFADLPPRVRALHLAEGTQRYHGAATITRGRGLLAHLCGLATGLPPAMHEAPLSVDIQAAPAREQWTRNFGGHLMTSAMRQGGPLLRERLGLVTFGFALSVEQGVLCWRVQEVRALFLPLPARWFQGVYARESEREGRYRFEVAAALPLAGPLVHYSGWLDVRVQSGEE